MCNLNKQKERINRSSCSLAFPMLLCSFARRTNLKDDNPGKSVILRAEQFVQKVPFVNRLAKEDTIQLSIVGQGINVSRKLDLEWTVAVTCSENLLDNDPVQIQNQRWPELLVPLLELPLVIAHRSYGTFVCRHFAYLLLGIINILYHKFYITSKNIISI